MIKKFAGFIVALVLIIIFGLAWLSFFFYGLVGFLIFVSSVLSLQCLFTLNWMLYAWASPENEKNIAPPILFHNPKLFFTLIVPARNEEKVINDTLKSIEQINYPNELFEVLVICRKDDIKTIEQVKKSANFTNKFNLRLILFNDIEPNKPKALNIGLSMAKGDVIGVFDAEDEPGREILNIVNNTMLTEGADVVQSGVQLMDHNSHWFSSLNVLEYYFWFKSGLHYYSKVWNMVPLAGNTVFFKKESLVKVNGWDENCLTEDADIGIRLSENYAKIRVVYDEKCLTKEETPHTTKSFIKQRTRWMQGFMQILLKGDWLKLPTFKQKVICVYILISPVIQSLLLIYIPFGLIIVFTTKIPLFISLISYLPFYFMVIQILVYIIGLSKFTKTHRKDFSIEIMLKVLIYYYPYQLALAYSAFRAVGRILMGTNIWEKTTHTNNHRLFE